MCIRLYHKNSKYVFEYNMITTLIRYNLTSIIRHSIIRHLDCMIHFLSTKISGVNLPQYYDYDYDAHNRTFLGLVCHVTKVINVHK